MAGKLWFRYSAMGAGKSIHILQVANNYEVGDKRVALFTAQLDHRSGERGVIESRLGVRRVAETFDANTVFDADLIGPAVSCVLVDEAQFLQPDQVRQLHKMAHQLGVPVICYGLRSDFKADPFPGSAMLLTLSDAIEELRRVCSCERKATMNVRIDAEGRRVREGDQIQIGGDESYKAVCPSCFYRDASAAS